MAKIPASRLPWLALFPLLALHVGCSSNEVLAPAAPGDTGPCAALRDQCLTNQGVCVESAAGAACQACGAGTYASRETNTCEPLTGTPLVHDFPEFTTKPGEESVGLCRSWTLNNPEEIWVNSVELSQDEASHHSNWMAVPSDLFEGPDGVWPCKDRKYSQFTAALYGDVLFAQSTQATHEVQRFPNNAATRVPPYSRIISDVHLLNTGDKDVTGNATLTIYSLPKEEVNVKLAPFHMDYSGLAIPPYATSRFTGECDIAGQFPSGKLAMKVYYVLPHTHALGSRFFFEAADGPASGEPIIDISGFNGEARGRYYDPPVDLAGTTNLRFGCEFTNPRADSVGWGFGDQEMCEFLGFADAKMAFESTVDEAATAGNDGSTALFTGYCSTVAFLWDNNKPGGPGPSN